MPSARPFTKWVELPGSEKRLPPGAEAAEQVPAAETFEVFLHLRRKKALPNLLKGTKRPAQPMTREEYARNYGASPADIQKVRAFVQHFQLHVQRVSSVERIVSVVRLCLSKT
jgi:kumamolisin